MSDRNAAQMSWAARQQICLAHPLRNWQYAVAAGNAVFAPGRKCLLQPALASANAVPN